MSGWVCPNCKEVESDSMLGCGTCLIASPHAAHYFRFRAKQWFWFSAPRAVALVRKIGFDLAHELTQVPPEERPALRTALMRDQQQELERILGKSVEPLEALGGFTVRGLSPSALWGQPFEVVPEGQFTT